MKGAAVAREHQPIRSDLGWSTTDRITVRGLDLANEIIGHFNLGDMAFLEFTGRKPTPAESKLFNAVTVTRAWHNAEFDRRAHDHRRRTGGAAGRRCGRPVRPGQRVRR